jgi:hypothetical protein
MVTGYVIYHVLFRAPSGSGPKFYVLIKCVEHFKGRSIVKSYEELQNRAFLCLRYSNLANPNDSCVWDNFSSKKSDQ